MATKFERKKDEILDSVLRFLDNSGSVLGNEERLFTIFRDAYDRGFCGPLRYYLYADTGCLKWITSRPCVFGDSILVYAVRTCYIRGEADSHRRRQLERIRSLWDAWSFALHQLGRGHRRHGWLPKDPSPPTSTNCDKRANG